MSTVFITGGAKRIGKYIAIDLAKKGFNIAFSYNQSLNEAIETKKEIEKYNVKCSYYKIDISNLDGLSKEFDIVYNDFPDLKILINSASIFKKNTLLDTTNVFLTTMFNINFFAPYIFTREFAKNIKSGLIINILDTKIFKNGYNYSAYLLSKKALLELTKQSALDFAPNIRVNGIAPGLILPPEGQNDDYLNRLAENIPMKKKGSPDLICSTVNYLITNDYITGVIIPIDGGQHIQLGEY